MASSFSWFCHPRLRGIGGVGAAALVLLLPTAGVAAERTLSPAEQRAAALTVLDQVAADPPTVPANWTHAQDLNHASAAFIDWQRATLRESAALTPELRALARRKSVVPLPPDAPLDLTHQLHLSVPHFLDPDGRFAKEVIISAEAPTVTLSLGAEGKLFSTVGASYKAGVAYATGAHEFAFTDAAEVQVGHDFGGVEVSGSYQFFSNTWAPPEGAASDQRPRAGQISAQIAMVKGVVGYNSQGEMNVGLGYDLAKTPKALSSIFEAAVNVNLDVAAPVKMRLAVKDGPLHYPTVSSAYSEKVARLLAAPVACPYCRAEGKLHCPTCSDTGKNTCPDCVGAKLVTCSRCQGTKVVDCWKCNNGQVRCGRCGGDGKLSCNTCGGSGRTTYYETVSKAYSEPVLETVGYDGNGLPIVQVRHQTVYRDTQEARSQACSSCSGSGDGGSCDNCLGDGWYDCPSCTNGKVACGRCSGTGKENCHTCKGTGQVTCTTCGARATPCPVCHGRQKIG